MKTETFCCGSSPSHSTHCDMLALLHMNLCLCAAFLLLSCCGSMSDEHTFTCWYFRTAWIGRCCQAVSKRQLINTLSYFHFICHSIRQYVSLLKQAVSHSRMKLFQTSHCASPNRRSGDSKEMMNDTRTKADRCDKYNVEWLINLMRGEGNEGKTAAGISWCESAEAKGFDWQRVQACVCVFADSASAYATVGEAFSRAWPRLQEPNRKSVHPPCLKTHTSLSAFSAR